MPLNLCANKEVPVQNLNQNIGVISISPQTIKQNEKIKDLFTIETETKFTFPISKTSKDYNILKDIIKEHIKYGTYELDFQKIKESIDHVEKAIFYLKNIDNDISK